MEISYEQGDKKLYAVTWGQEKSSAALTITVPPGEVFVLGDGSEVDLDLGCYERFLDATFTSDNNITSGKVYSQVIKKERNGDYMGETVQIIPHITNHIQDLIMKQESKRITIF